MNRLFSLGNKVVVSSLDSTLAPIFCDPYENTWLNMSINTRLPVGYPLVTRGYPSYKGSNFFLFTLFDAISVHECV